MTGLGRPQSAYDRFAAAVELPLTVVAILWLPLVVIPFVAHLGPSVSRTFEAVDYLVWAMFAVEYMVKAYLSPVRWAFVRHHPVDLVVVVVPVLRPLRALRLLRFFDLGRMGAVMANALKRAREIITHRGLHFVLLVVLVLVFVMAAVELAFEQHAPGATIHSYGDALWWAIVTLTTVGYGDNYPVTAGGRAAAVVLMLVGIGLIGVLTATVASYFVEEKADRDKNDLDGLERIETALAEVLALAERWTAARAPEAPDGLGVRHTTANASAQIDRRLAVEVASVVSRD